MKAGPRIFLLTSALLLTFFLLDRLYTFGLLHNQNLKLTNTALHPPDAELLVHGPCEPLWIVSPALIGKHTGTSSYNLALSHSDFADNFLHLYLYLKNNRPPRYLFLYVTPESFDKRFNVFNSYRFAPYLGDPVVREVIAENDPAYAGWAPIPFMRYAYYGKRITFSVIQGLKHYFQDRTTAYYPDGFEPPARRVWGNHQDSFSELYDRDVVFVKDSLREKYLARTIRLAKEHGTEVYLYESPVLSEAIPFQRNRTEMIALIKETAAREKVRFVQFSDLPMSRRRELFNSALTLNMKGVVIFNDTLGRFIKATCFPEKKQ